MTKDRRGQFHMPDARCLGCGKLVDGATNMLGPSSPDAGDVTICIYCGRLMAFKDDLTFRELTGAEMMEVMQDPRVQLIEQARQEAMKKGKP